MDFSNLRIDRIVMHEIFKRNIDKSIKEPRYGNELSPLSLQGLDTLEERIVSVLGRDSSCMEMDIIKTETGSCIDLINRLINSNDEQFVNISKDIAKNLAEAQTSRRMPGGIVIVIQGELGTYEVKRFICIIKAEIHNGFTRSDELLLEFLSELVLTPQQKLYKVACYIEEDRKVEELNKKYSLYVFDQNMKKSDTKEFATYFYQLFLGSDFKKNGKIITKNFYELTKDYINSMNIEDDKKVDLNMSLYTYVKNNKNQTLSVDEFSKEYMPVEYSDKYKTYMYEGEIPKGSFKRDIIYLNNKLKQRRIRFTNNVSIMCPADKFKESIKISEIADNQTMIVISGKVKDQQ